MNSLILRTAAQYLLPIMLLFSVFLLLRGHQEPGGGFVGGLVASAALILYAIGYDTAALRQVLRCDPRMLIGVGLSVALVSGLVALLNGQPFLTGQWVSWSVPGIGEIDVGTPLLFDVGVYIVVLGVNLTITLSLLEQ